MAREALNCWHCGVSLEALPLPVGRREECPHCSSSLHVCRMCRFFDRSASKACREPMADEVTDKEHANFCDYFGPAAGLTGGADQEAANARARLQALFGELGGPAHKPGSKRPVRPTESARGKLDAFFDRDPD